MAYYPVLKRLLPTLGAAYGLQAALACVFVPLQTEKYYDLGGSLGYLSTAFVSLHAPYLHERFWLGNSQVKFPSISSHAPRQLLLTGALVFWAGRLGTFLFQRVSKQGKDSRFDEIKKNPIQFTGAWLAQATWITLVGMPVWVANSVPAHIHAPLGVRDAAGLTMFALAFLFEIVADRQKSTWREERNEKKHEEKFISSGLWSISRHPNYVGEVGIWTGLWLLSTKATASQLAYFPRGVSIATAISPIFTYFLINKISGVPLLEESAEKRFGNDPEWKDYKRRVPIFFPWMPSNSSE